MRKLLVLLLWGATLLLSAGRVAAQNSVVVLGTGPQPPNTTGCAVNPNCIPATWSTTSNAGSDITTPITANFVFVPNGGALATDFPTATTGQICLADNRDLTGTTLFGQIAANCQAARGVALLLRHVRQRPKRSGEIRAQICTRVVHLLRKSPPLELWPNTFCIMATESVMPDLQRTQNLSVGFSLFSMSL